MIAPASTNAQYYMKLQNQSVPINIVPSGIKCITCNQTYSKEQFNQHLATHINPQYFKISQAQNSSTPFKLNLAQLVEDPEKTEDIWVSSFLPSDMPSVEKQRKIAVRPTGQYHTLKSGQILRSLNVPGPDQQRKDISSNIGQTVGQSVQGQENLSIKKKIQLAKVSNPISKKQIQVYMNDKKRTINYDTYTSRKRAIKDQETQQSDGYRVMEAPVQEYNSTKGPILLGSLTKSKKQNRQTYQISSSLKNPGHSLTISTISKPIFTSTKEEPEKSQKDRLGQSRSTIIGGMSRYQPDHDQNHKCPCCHGFYCRQCKSSVPPIYRPVPDKDGNYHFHPKKNQRAIEFYQEHYYPRDVNVCTSCEKNMVLGKIIEQRQ